MGKGTPRGLNVRQERRGEEIVWRVCRGKNPVGSEQVPARPADGGGFRTEAEALALRSVLLRRIGERT